MIVALLRRFSREGEWEILQVCPIRPLSCQRHISTTLTTNWLRADWGGVLLGNLMSLGNVESLGINVGSASLTSLNSLISLNSLF